MNEPRLRFKVDPPSILLPVDLQLEVGVSNSIAPEGGRGFAGYTDAAELIRYFCSLGVYWGRTSELGRNMEVSLKKYGMEKAWRNLYVGRIPSPQR